MPLPATDNLFHDETPLSGAIRHAGLMGYPSSSWIGDLCGRRFPALLSDREALERLAGWLAVDTEEMVRRGHLASDSPGKVNFWGDAISSKFVNPGVVRLCPLCIREQPYLKSIWSLDLCRVCHIHECTLIETWPGCRSGIGFDRADFKACECEKCRNAEDPTKKRYPAAAGVWRQIHYLLHGGEMPAEKLGNLPPEFKSLSLEELLKGLVLFQVLHAGGVNGDTLEAAIRTLAGMQDAKFHHAQEAAAQFIIGWPQSIRALLAQQLRRPGYQARIIDHALTHIAPVLSWDLEPALGFIGTEVMAGIDIRWRSTMQSFRGNAYVPDEEKVCMASGDAEALLGMKPVEVRRCFETEMLTPGTRSGSTRSRLFVVNRKAVMEALENPVRHQAQRFDILEENVSFSKACSAAHVLKLDERSLLDALRHGHIAYGFVAGVRKCVGTARINYKSLIAYLQRVIPTAAPQWISFTQASDISLFKPKTLESICTQHSIEVRGDKGYPDTREVHLESLLGFKRHHQIVARLSPLDSSACQIEALSPTT